MNNLASDVPVAADADKRELARWCLTTFVPDPDRGYYVNSPATAKYTSYRKKHEPVTIELILAALEGTTHRLERDGHHRAVPISIAVVPEHRDGWARAAIIAINAGELAAVERILALCRQYGLWAFAQRSTSSDHEDDYISIPVSQALPASLLWQIAVRLQTIGSVQGEIYPDHAEGLHESLSLPLMTHFGDPNGSYRYPLLLPTGEQIDATDPWAALACLHARWQPNTAAALMQAFCALPAVPIRKPPQLHQSRVNPQKHDSVRRWFNDHFSLEELLNALSVQIASEQIVTCPWHDDRSPSLVLWQHSTGKMVCRCFSIQSNCPAASLPFLDAFDIYCLVEGQQPPEAVQSLVSRHNLGQRRTTRIETVSERAATSMCPERLAAHELVIREARERLREALGRGADQQGRVTVIRATPGLGKTHMAAELARRLHAEGRRVAIVTPTHRLAEQEWAARVPDALVWQPRTSICTCHYGSYLQQLADLNYELPKCQPSCPYRKQRLWRKSKIVIYQHHHLHLNDAELLEDTDVIIVDESPLSALVVEHTVTQHELQKLLDRLKADDSAVPLAQALVKSGVGTSCLSGAELIPRLDQELLGKLREEIAQARPSPAAQLKPSAKRGVDPASLPQQFLGQMVEALAHDVDHPNKLLAYEGKWTWYEKRAFLKSPFGMASPPAVIVLDGSADQLISEQLYAPWPVETLSIDVPVSPSVTIVQCGLTQSTRMVTKDKNRLASLTRGVASVCAELGVVLDGGVCYKNATEHFAETHGGAWLHYGNQRGQNDLAQAQAVALIASPTVPYKALERKAMALWSKASLAINCSWPKAGKADYRATDERLEAVNRLYGREELRQAAHRCRPILSCEPTTLLIFSPWDLEQLGLAPDKIVTGIAYGNSIASQQEYEEYQKLRSRRQGEDSAGEDAG